MKKFTSLLLILAMIFTFTACTTSKNNSKDVDNNKNVSKEDDKSQDNSKETKSSSKDSTLVVWTFTDEIKGMIENYYLKDNPDLPYEVEVVVIPNDQYQSKLDPSLSSGKSAPDVFALEAAYVNKYIDSDYTKDLADVGIDKNNLDTMQYVIDVASDTDGNLKGLSWQATPGAFFYRRSIAKKYLGTDDPKEVQEMVSDFDKFYDTAKEIYDKSNGEVKAISSLGDLIQVFYAARKDGWIVDNKFVIDPKIEELLEMGRKLESEHLTNEAEQWSEQWFASMSGNDVFGYFLPTWGLHYNLKTNAVNAETGESTDGDWAMIQGPSPYFWGGTWVSMREGTEMEEAAADLIRYLTLDENFLTTWARDTGDFLSNQKVVDAIKDDYSEPFLNGQNHYAAFAQMAPAIDASILTGSDKDIQDLFTEQLTAYSKGEKDKETALKDFKTSVQNLFPNLKY